MHDVAACIDRALRDPLLRQRLHHQIGQVALACGTEIEKGRLAHPDGVPAEAHPVIPDRAGQRGTVRGQRIAAVVAEPLERRAHQRSHRAVRRLVEKTVDGHHRVDVVREDHLARSPRKVGDERVGAEPRVGEVEGLDPIGHARPLTLGERLGCADRPSRADRVEDEVRLRHLP